MQNLFLYIYIYLVWLKTTSTISAVSLYIPGYISYVLDFKIHVIVWSIWNWVFCEKYSFTQLLSSGGSEDFLGGSDDKESTCHTGDSGSIPGSGRPPGEGNGYPLQYCLENSMDKEAWRAAIHRVTKSQTRLID